MSFKFDKKASMSNKNYLFVQNLPSACHNSFLLSKYKDTQYHWKKKAMYLSYKVTYDNACQDTFDYSSLKKTKCILPVYDNLREWELKTSYSWLVEIFTTVLCSRHNLTNGTDKEMLRCKMYAETKMVNIQCQ